MNTAKYPLLIGGLFTDQNGGNNSLVAPGAGARVSWSNNIVQSRGNMVALDVVPSYRVNQYQGANLSFQVFVSGVAIIQNAEIETYQITSLARSYELTQINQPAGQTIALTAIGGAANGQGAVVHIYYENNCATPAIMAARNKSVLKQRTIELGGTLLGGSKFVEFNNSFTIPKNMGNVVAVQLITTDASTGSDVSRSTFTVSMGGTNIFQDVCGALTYPQSCRPGLIFPILIRGGETFSISANTAAAAIGSTIFVRLKLFFDEDLDGTKNYELLPCTQ